MDTPETIATSSDSVASSPLHCPLCSRQLTQRHCKRLCENCGYTESCEDLFGPQAYPGPASLRDELA